MTQSDTPGNGASAHGERAATVVRILRVLRNVARAGFSLLLLLSAVWVLLALSFRLPQAMFGKWLLCGLCGLYFLALLILLWRARAWIAAPAYALMMAAVLLWWNSIEASNQRQWIPELSRQLQAEVQGSVVTLHNVRNFDWHSETDYVEGWETRRYDLDRLRRVDAALGYWMGPAIAHTLVSFGFDDGRGGLDYLSFSIEIRKERGERYSTLAGFFKQYELSLIAADERDVIRVRTDARQEDVYLYSIAMPQAAIRSLFLAYVDKAAALAHAPRFYNTLTANCTTLVFDMVRRIIPGLPMDYRLILSGYLPGYLYDIGGLAPGYPLQALRRAGHITARAREAAADAYFSSTIRRGVPSAAVAGGDTGGDTGRQQDAP